MGADSVVGLEIVTPDGRYLNVREGDPEHGELLRACKGAGGSTFGVILRYYFAISSIHLQF